MNDVPAPKRINFNIDTGIGPRDLDDFEKVVAKTDRCIDSYSQPKSGFKKEHARTRSMLMSNHPISLRQVDILGTSRISDEHKTHLDTMRRVRNKKLIVERLNGITNSNKAENENLDDQPTSQRSPQNVHSSKGEEEDYYLSLRSNANIAICRIDLSSFGFDLQTIVDETEPMGVINLPEHVIKVQELIINKPITIAGSASSTIDVSHSIHIDLSGYPKKDQKVVFSECSLNFEYSNKRNPSQSTSTKRSKESSEKRSYSETININVTRNLSGQATTDVHRTEGNSTIESRIYPLFVIYGNSTLDLRDCRITSKNTDFASQAFRDTCFYLKNPQNSVLKKSDGHPTLMAQSTFITNFYSVVQNSILGKIYIEKLYVSHSRNHVLNISNPYILDMKECIIEDSTKSCVNLRFSKDIPSDTERSILIEKNDFTSGQSYGISIFGENTIHQNCSIKLSNNKISGFQKDGIGVKNLNIREVLINENQIDNNKGNGICIHNVLDTQSFSQVQCFKNKISQSHLYGLTLIDVSFYSEDDEISLNSKGGIIISAGDKIQNKQEFIFYKNHPIRTILNSTQMVQNRDSGLIVVGSMKGPIILKSCQIKENTNGLYIKQSPIDLPENGQVYSPRESVVQGLGDIVLEKCSIVFNTLSGIYLRNVASKMYMKETVIHGNKNYAIFIQNPQDVDNLNLDEDGKARIREYISGHIGGTWGMIYEQNSNICKTSKCSMF